jgi:squalene-hopene cyclase-like protein
MSSFTRRGTAAIVLIASLALGTAVQASAAPARTKPAPTAAAAGASWLGTQFTGKEIETGGAPDPSSTVQAVLAFAASGVGAKKAKGAMAWLKKNFESYVSVGGVDDAGSLAYVILAAQAMGDDPSAFGGKKPANNLIARLEATQRTSGTDAGLFGASDPTYDGAFRQGLALAALANQGVSSSAPVMTAAVSWLQAQQCSDGGWESYRSVETACPAPDPTSFVGPDTNSTSLAVMGLVAAGATFTYDPTAFFESAQNTDGGFEFVGAPSAGSSDPDSTGEVIQALVALNQLSNPAFDQDGNTPQSALATFQLTCSAGATEDGAYQYPGEPGPNLLATLQAIPGAAEKPFPIKAGTGVSGLPKLKCPAA